jgi:maltose alpha-D-glucosyltransferase/alpha-amylase
MRRLVGEKIESMKIRVHGDYHLGQVLYTGNDFVIIDFEGEPARPVSERRLKRSPFRDVAGMIRSFHYAAHSSFMRYAADHPKGASLLEPWVGPWFSVVSSVYLQTYMKTVGNAPFVPRNPEELAILLETFLLEKAVYELDYEMNNRPSWVHIPMKGIRQVLASPWG